MRAHRCACVRAGVRTYMSAWAGVHVCAGVRVCACVRAQAHSHLVEGFRPHGGLGPTLARKSEPFCTCDTQLANSHPSRVCLEFGPWSHPWLVQNALHLFQTLSQGQDVITQPLQQGPEGAEAEGAADAQERKHPVLHTQVPLSQGRTPQAHNHFAVLVHISFNAHFFNFSPAQFFSNLRCPSPEGCLSPGPGSAPGNNA